ncbi:hypothetical protein T05_7712 [Trichinella murrelli]|uniref:Uncharacterized protein n=1 Tax=Trichinella murrelli TaxID=144512 RepID=A0A0V0TWV9_9BILA|nr:hypothetical protein T05_7712 [Trichinella murrelli]
MWRCWLVMVELFCVLFVVYMHRSVIGETVYLEKRRAAVGEVPYPLVNIGSVLKLVEFYEC